MSYQEIWKKLPKKERFLKKSNNRIFQRSNHFLRMSSNHICTCKKNFKSKMKKYKVWIKIGIKEGNILVPIELQD